MRERERQRQRQRQKDRETEKPLNGCCLESIVKRGVQCIPSAPRQA